MIIRSPSGRLARMRYTERSARPMRVPPMYDGMASGFMNGAECLSAERSWVSGTQCSTSVPNSVTPKASPSRWPTNSCSASTALSLRRPSPNVAVMLPDTSSTNSMFESTRWFPWLSGRCGPASSTIATASSSGAQRFTNLTTPSSPWPRFAPEWSNGMASTVPRRRHSQTSSSTGSASRTNTAGKAKVIRGGGMA